MKVYLASPYSSNLPSNKRSAACILGNRYSAAVDAAAWLIRNNYIVYSPIVSWHAVAVKHRLPKGYLFWEKQDDEMLNWCDKLFILTYRGWEQSEGIAAENNKAVDLGKEVMCLSRRAMIDAYNNKLPLYLVETLNAYAARLDQ